RGRPGWVLRFTRDDGEASGSAARLHQAIRFRAQARGPVARVRVQRRRRREGLETGLPRRPPDAFRFSRWFSRGAASRRRAMLCSSMRESRRRGRRLVPFHTGRTLMSMIARGLLAGLLLLAGYGAAPTTSVAEQRGAELAPLAAWVGKSTQKANIEG